MDNSNQRTTVGRVVGLWRYPVKSMGAESLTEVEVSWHGLSGDRRWAFVRDGVEKSGFPWLTIRNRANMSHYSPYFTNPENPDSSSTRVRTPAGTDYDVTDPALAKELYPAGAKIIRQNRGVYDAFPLSLISKGTLNRLEEQVGSTLDVQRFRPNILIESSENKPFVEEEWVGHELVIGEMRMRVDKRDGRCMVITIDPTTAEPNSNVLRTVVEEHEGCLGVYGTIVQPGTICEGDPVKLIG